MSTLARNLAFDELVRAACSCDSCPRMRGRRRVLGSGNGSPGAHTLFVAEAPGRLGAERSGIPLHGDQSGKNFERLLAAAGLRRDDVFVTNAVLCNPQSPDGLNDRPSRVEIAACTRFLSSTISVVDPELVIALGVSALAALARIEAHSLRLRFDLARPVRWFGRRLAVLYHPSPRTRVFRSFDEQLDDLHRCLTLARCGPRAQPESSITQPS